MFLGRCLRLMILRPFYLQIVKTFIYTTVSRRHLLLVVPIQRKWTLVPCLGRHQYLALLDLQPPDGGFMNILGHTCRMSDRTINLLSTSSG